MSAEVKVDATHEFSVEEPDVLGLLLYCIPLRLNESIGEIKHKFEIIQEMDCNYLKCHDSMCNCSYHFAISNMNGCNAVLDFFKNHFCLLYRQLET